jgi:hypothetical protein
MPEIGPTLREARMRARIDISEIEAQTKIRAKYLRALENEEWGLLPGPTFVRSFLRTYAEALGLDPRPLVDEYRTEYEHPDAAHEPIMPTARRGGGNGGEERASSAYRIAVAAIVVLIVVLAVLLVLGKKSSSGGSPSKSGDVTLSLRATQTARVCLSEGGGGRLLHYETLAAGQHTRSYSASEFALWSSSRTLRLTIDGTEHSLPAAGAYSVTSSGALAAGSEGRLRACG